jgi:cell division protein FtsB
LDSISAQKSALQQEKVQFLESISTHKAENAHLKRSIEVTNQDMNLLRAQLAKTEQSLAFHQKFKIQFEDEKARNNCNTQSMRDNLEVFQKMNTDYDRCLFKMQEMESKII